LPVSVSAFFPRLLSCPLFPPGFFLHLLPLLILSFLTVRRRPVFVGAQCSSPVFVTLRMFFVCRSGGTFDPCWKISEPPLTLAAFSWRLDNSFSSPPPFRESNPSRFWWGSDWPCHFTFPSFASQFSVYRGSTFFAFASPLPLSPTRFETFLLFF